MEDRSISCVRFPFLFPVSPEAIDRVYQLSVVFGELAVGTAGVPKLISCLHEVSMMCGFHK